MDIPTTKNRCVKGYRFEESLLLETKGTTPNLRVAEQPAIAEENRSIFWVDMPSILGEEKSMGRLMIAKIAGPKFLRRREERLPRNEKPNGPLNFIGGNYYSPRTAMLL